MGKLLSDHQESDCFSYSRSWEEIENMLDVAERKLNHHSIGMAETNLKLNNGGIMPETSRPCKVLLKHFDGL